MKIYVAAMFSKKDYVRDLVHPVLVEAGHQPTARWVDQHAQDKMSERDRGVMDLQDVARADVLVLLTNEFGTMYSGGGRMVEFGYALALGKHVFVVGSHEMIFCHLPQVMVCSSISVVVDQLNLMKPPEKESVLLRRIR
jgi:nucleoside 2-deoxyribosyltransferase